MSRNVILHSNDTIKTHIHRIPNDVNGVMIPFVLQCHSEGGNGPTKSDKTNLDSVFDLRVLLMSWEES